MGEIIYRSDRAIAVQEFIDVLKRSTLSKRRPVNDADRMQRMLDHADVLVTAWAGELLVGVSRAVTDFSFCCYLSDLAVDTAFQRKGIGRELIMKTHEAAGKETKLILLAVPTAVPYYQHIKMIQFHDCFIMS